MADDEDADNDEDAVTAAVHLDESACAGAVQTNGPTRAVGAVSYNAVDAPLNGTATADGMNGEGATRHGESAVVVSAVSVRRLVSAGISAIKANAIPGAVLLTAALVLVLSYYNSANVQSAFDAVAAVKSQYSYAFSAVSTAIAGGSIPAAIVAIKEAFAVKAPTPRQPSMLVEALFLTAFWAYKGVEVDAFYQLQALMFGDGNDAGTVAAKVAVDQFVYNPLWAAHSVLIPYMLKDKNFHFTRTYDAVMTAEYIAFTFPTTLLSTWMVWIPSTSLIYCLPSPLQIPLFNFALAFWALILQLLAKNKQRDDMTDSKLTLNHAVEASDEQRRPVLEHGDDEGDDVGGDDDSGDQENASDDDSDGAYESDESAA